MTPLALAVVAGAFLALQFAHRPAAEEMAEEEAEAKVSESEMDLYIGVYTAMQADHDLTVDRVLADRQVAIEKFRDIERRVQADQRLVDRVRLALLNQARSQIAWQAQAATATPAVPAPTGTPKPAAKKRRSR